jgi:hypothetical protein
MELSVALIIAAVLVMLKRKGSLGTGGHSQVLDPLRPTRNTRNHDLHFLAVLLSKHFFLDQLYGSHSVDV